MDEEFTGLYKDYLNKDREYVRKNKEYFTQEKVDNNGTVHYHRRFSCRGKWMYISLTFNKTETNRLYIECFSTQTRNRGKAGYIKLESFEKRFCYKKNLYYTIVALVDSVYHQNFEVSI